MQQVTIWIELNRTKIDTIKHCTKINHNAISVSNEPMFLRVFQILSTFLESVPAIRSSMQDDLEKMNKSKLQHMKYKGW
jgi:hypothetical protein